MIIGKEGKRGKDDLGFCTTCQQWVHLYTHMCREEMFGTRERRSANLDDLLSELKTISALLTAILQIAGSKERRSFRSGGINQ